MKEWSQPTPALNLDINKLEILKLIMCYVDEAHKVEIDAGSIEQELQDLEDSIEHIAMAIEQGKFRKEDER